VVIVKRGQVMRQKGQMKRADDETVIKEVDDWQLSYSVSEKTLYIDTVSYHPPRLQFSRDDLQKLMDTIDNMIKSD
jgi:hypothetical protein